MNSDPNKSAQPCGCDPGQGWVCVIHSPLRIMGTGEIDKKSFPTTYATQRPIPTFAPNLAAQDASSGGGISNSGVIFNNPRGVLIQPSAKAAHAPTLDNRITTLPDDPAGRKRFPICSGCFDYFPNALAAIAEVSWAGNEQHNPGEPLHWAREKSADHEDTHMRHFGQRGTFDVDGKRHTAKAAWRMLAILELEITKNRGVIE
jgi:hypothetical protein